LYERVYYSPMNLKGIPTTDRILIAIIAIFGTAGIALGIGTLIVCGEYATAVALTAIIMSAATVTAVVSRR
jgi:hypothetical protein